MGKNCRTVLIIKDADISLDAAWLAASHQCGRAHTAKRASDHRLLLNAAACTPSTIVVGACRNALFSKREEASAAMTRRPQVAAAPMAILRRQAGWPEACGMAQQR